MLFLLSFDCFIVIQQVIQNFHRREEQRNGQKPLAPWTCNQAREFPVILKFLTPQKFPLQGIDIEHSRRSAGLPWKFADIIRLSCKIRFRDGIRGILPFAHMHFNTVPQGSFEAGRFSSVNLDFTPCPDIHRGSVLESSWTDKRIPASCSGSPAILQDIWHDRGFVCQKDCSLCCCGLFPYGRIFLLEPGLNFGKILFSGRSDRNFVCEVRLLHVSAAHGTAADCSSIPAWDRHPDSLGGPQGKLEFQLIRDSVCDDSFQFR